ncbi:hypothetical protein ACFQWB_10465 [Paenibacillus thermoaerophilus]|uniref:Uncharacterized protein n=1 Tax=Paenibacillus thermoaerophilus TaxID=1215385 RepID=A0ABW2V2L4_9BACL|nr:hypothetical protein [Paenibacillus thermoaerophilus]TMV18802.1 hypothetical protein FE781_02425 [Paenibacillus thermoaerophilus]
MRLSRIWIWFVLALVAIGIVSTLATNWIALAIPTGLGLIVWLLYKYPPKRYARGQARYKGASKSSNIPVIKKSIPRGPYRKSQATRRKDIPFRVIEGRKSSVKKDNEDKKLLH